MSFAQPFTDYEILARVGAGAMGTVFRARQKKLNRIVALKVLRPSLARDTHYVDRLRREARIVASLNHPNIVAGYDVGEEGGYHFFVMEYFEGPSLRTLLSEWGMFPEAQVLETAIQVVEALDHAYQTGVIHRDIKPGNILINDRGEVKLTDMGLAKGPTDMALTRDGATVGTPQYISPEQARTPQEVDIRSDLYSLGATLYHMATGQTPFTGDSMAEVITKLLQERAPSATDLNPKLSDGLSLVIRKLMAKDPDLRYQTPRELLDDLYRVQREEDPEVDLQRLEAAEVTPPSGTRRRIAIGVGFALVIASSIWVGSLVRGSGDDRMSREEFARYLQTELGAQEHYRGRLEFLAGAEERAADTDQSRDVAARRQSLVRELEQEIDGLVRETLRATPLRDWVWDPTHWRDPDAWGRDLRSEIETLSGYSEPPDYLQLSGLDDALSAIPRLIQERDTDYLARLSEYLTVEATAAYRMPLESDDFSGAVTSLETSLASVFQRPGEASRNQLSDQLRIEVSQRLGKFRDEVTLIIEKEEAALAGRLKQSAARELESVAELLQDPDGNPDFDLLRERVGQLPRDLAGRYPGPESFGVGTNPWRDVEEDINQMLSDIALTERGGQSQRLERWLSLAYGALAQRGDFNRARGWLDPIEVEGQVLTDRLERHRAVLNAAQTVAHAVLETLSEVEGPVIVHRRVDPNRELTLSIKGDTDAGFQVQASTPGGMVMADSLVDVLFSDLLEQALVRAPDLLDPIPRAGEGVALCLLVSGQDDRAERDLSAEDKELFGQEIWPRLQRVFEEREQALSGEEGRALEDLRGAHLRSMEGGSIVVLRRTLNEFRRRFPTVAEENAEIVGDIETWLLDAEGRRKVEEDLRTASLPGAEIRVDQKMQATVTYSLPALREIELPNGWSLGETALGFQLSDVPLSRALELELALPLPLPRDRGYGLTARLQFSPVGNEPRLWLFECGDVGLALGLLANDSVVAAMVGAEDLGNAEILRDVLQQPMADAIETPRAFVIPGAIHELTLKIVPDTSGNRLLAEAWLDGKALLRDAARITERRRAGEPRAELGIIPTQPLALLQVQLSGSFR